MKFETSMTLTINQCDDANVGSPGMVVTVMVGMLLAVAEDMLSFHH